MSDRDPDRAGGAFMRRLGDAAQGTARTLGALASMVDAPGSSKLPLSLLAWRVLRRSNQRRIRRRCAVVQTSAGVALCRVLGHFKMYVDPRDHGHAVHLMLDGYWEMAVTQAVAALLPPGATAVDIGANQGYYTMLMAGLVGPEGRVHAVEPHPHMAGLLRRSVMANGFRDRVVVHEQPVGARDGDEVVLHAEEELPSGGFVQPAPEGVAGTMRTVTIDTVAGHRPVDFVKIDAEGAEMAAWEGMHGTLALGRPMVVVMEFVLDRVPDAAGFLADVRAQGFSLSYIDARRGIQPVAADRIFAAPSNQEWMLLLRR